MPRKTKFIVSRHTWSSDQFEFSVLCPYEECLTRLRRLEVELQTNFDKHGNRGIRPSLKLESDHDASSFEIVIENSVVAGTVQQITDETTLFIGLSQFTGLFYFIEIMLVIAGMVGVMIPFLSAYVMQNSANLWSTHTLQFALLACLIPIIGTLIFYPLLRWDVWRAVNKLVSAMDY
jgi:hypothetical protein